jgi:hypothetical protein
MAATNKCLARSNKSRTEFRRLTGNKIYLSRTLTDAIRTAKGEEDCPQFTSVRPAGGGV